MHRFTLSLALLTVALLACDASAVAPENQPAGKRGEGEKGANRGPARQGRGGPGAQRDPAQMVARMMQEFDKDGDQKLDSTELAALMTSMRQRRAQIGGQAPDQARRGRPGQAQQGRGKPGQGKPGADRQRRRRGSDDVGNPGGERPERPASD